MEDPINRRSQTPPPPLPAVVEPTLCVAGGRYAESWLRTNASSLHGVLAEFVLDFLVAVDRARSDAADRGGEPELVQLLKAPSHRNAPDIPVHYEAPSPWRVVQRTVPAPEA